MSDIKRPRRCRCIVRFSADIGKRIDAARAGLCSREELILGAVSLFLDQQPMTYAQWVAQQRHYRAWGKFQPKGVDDGCD